MMGADPGISAFPECDNIFQWTGTITGGEGTVRPRPRACPCARARPGAPSPSLPRPAPRPAPLTPTRSCYAQVYEGHTYKLGFKFPTSYPYEAPQVTFNTPCFHPNVDQYGNICLDILKVRDRPAHAPSPPARRPRRPAAHALCASRAGEMVGCVQRADDPALDPEPAWGPQPRQPAERARRCDLAQRRRIQEGDDKAQEQPAINVRWEGKGMAYLFRSRRQRSLCIHGSERPSPRGQGPCMGVAVAGGRRGTDMGRTCGARLMMVTWDVAARAAPGPLRLGIMTGPRGAPVRW